MSQPPRPWPAPTPIEAALAARITVAEQQMRDLTAERDQALKERDGALALAVRYHQEREDTAANARSLSTMVDRLETALRERDAILTKETPVVELDFYHDSDGDPCVSLRTARTLEAQLNAERKRSAALALELEELRRGR